MVTILVLVTALFGAASWYISKQIEDGALAVDFSEAPYDVVVDGGYAAAEHLPGKPAPDTFERAAELLGLPTTACAVVEDAESGVKAGAAGEFGIVIGVDRGVGRDALVELGADVIVDELDELIPAVERAAAASDATTTDTREERA